MEALHHIHHMKRYYHAEKLPDLNVRFHMALDNSFEVLANTAGWLQNQDSSYTIWLSHAKHPVHLCLFLKPGFKSAVYLLTGGLDKALHM